jgi:hypothetical protein
MRDATDHLALEELDLWLDGRLPPSRTSHLETCEACRSAAEETRDLVLQLATLPRVEPRQSFVEQIMARVQAGGVPHLMPEDLDQWVEGALPAERESHLRACPECQALADAERVLVMRLTALPLFNPRPGFEERVLDRVPIPVTSFAGAWRFWRTRVFANPVSVGMAAGVAVLLGGSMAASAAWAAAHQDTITRVGPWLLAQGQQLFWQGVNSATSVLQQQPWYGQLRTELTPGRLAAAATATLAVYVAGVMALRRLLALPSPQVSRALP